MIKRWITNIKWLLNHPPTHQTYNRNPSEIVPCGYCEKDSTRIMVARYTSNDVEVTICLSCIKQALDKTLLNKEK